jgi:hypothetical protein
VSRQALGPTEPPVEWVSGGFSPRVKRGWGVTLTIPSTVEVKNEKELPPLSLVVCMAVEGELYFFT